MPFLINAVSSSQHCWQIGVVLKVTASLLGLQKRQVMLLLACGTVEEEPHITE